MAANIRRSGFAEVSNITLLPHIIQTRLNSIVMHQVHLMTKAYYAEYYKNAIARKSDYLVLATHSK